MTTVTLQFLIAQFLQDHGEADTVQIAAKFGADRNKMGTTLRSMRSDGYLTSTRIDPPFIWSVISMPNKTGRQGPKNGRTPKKQGGQIHAGFNLPQLNFIPTLPLVRL